MWDAVRFLIACAANGGDHDACMDRAMYMANPPYSTVTPSLVPNPPMPQWTRGVIELGPATSGSVPR